MAGFMNKSTAGNNKGNQMYNDYVALFMDKLEIFYPNTTLHHQWRYINNIFLVWPHFREELTAFISSFILIPNGTNP